VESLYLNGTFNGKKGSLLLNNLSGIVSVKNICKGLNISSLTANLQFDRGNIKLNDLIFDTKNSKMYGDGVIGKKTKIVLGTNKFDLNEFFLTFLKGQGNDICGIAEGKVIITNPSGIIVKGFAESKNCSVYNNKLKNAKTDFVYSSKEKAIRFNVKDATYLGGKVKGNIKYSKTGLSIGAEVSYFPLSEILGIKERQTSLFGNIFASGNFKNKNASHIEIKGEDMYGNLFGFKLAEKRSHFNICFDGEKITISNISVFSDIDEKIVIEGIGNKDKQEYRLKLKDIKYKIPGIGNSYIFGSGKFEYQNSGLSAIFYPKKIELLKNKYTDPIRLSGQFNIDVLKNTRIRVNLIASNITGGIFKGKYQFHPVVIEGGYRNNYLNITMKPKVIDRENNFTFNLYGKERLSWGFKGKLKFEKNTKNSFLNRINLLVDIKSKSDGFIGNVESPMLSFGKKETIKNFNLYLNKTTDRFIIDLKSDLCNGIITLGKHKKINGNINFNKFPLIRIFDLEGGKKSDFSGDLNGNLSIYGLIDAPEFNFKYEINNFARGDRYIGLISGNTFYSNGNLKFKNFRVYHKLYSLEAEGIVPFSISFSPFQFTVNDNILDIKLKLKDSDINILNFVTKDIPYIFNKKPISLSFMEPKKGNFSGNFAASGTWDDPEIEGILVLKGITAQIKYKPLNYLIEDFNGKIILNRSSGENQFILNNLNFYLTQDEKRGKLLFRGVTYLKNGEFTGNGKLKLEDGIFPFNTKDLSLQFSKISLNFNIGVDDGYIRGLMVIKKGQVNKNIINILDIIMNSFKKKKKKIPIIGKKLSLTDNEAINLSLLLKSENPIFFVGPSQNFSLSIDKIDIIGELSDIRIVGFADIIEGEVYGLGSTFRFMPSKIIFQNRTVFNPDIDITLTSMIKEYDVNINAAGEIVDPKIIFSSTPNLSSSEILTLILFKQTKFNGEEIGIYDIGVDILINEITQRLFHLTKKTSFGYLSSLMFDTVKIERAKNEFEKSQFESRWKFTLGKYLYSNLFIGYSRYEDSLYDQQMEFKFFLNPHLILSLNINISPYESRSFGDSIYIMMSRNFNLMDILKVRK
jgi:hypothetical protein